MFDSCVIKHEENKAPALFSHGKMIGTTFMDKDGWHLTIRQSDGDFKVLPDIHKNEFEAANALYSMRGKIPKPTKKRR